MFDLPLHPAIVHLPIGAALIVPLLVAALLIARRFDAVGAEAWWGAVMVQAVGLLGGVAAMRTGEGDEDAVEEVVSGRLIHGHEEAAELFVWLAGATLAVLLAAALVRWSKVQLAAGIGALVLGLATAGMALQVGHLGGELVYRHGAASVHVAAAAEAPAIEASPGASLSSAVLQASPAPGQAGARTDGDDDDDDAGHEDD